MLTAHRPTLLIDADDTLWENDQHYAASTARFIALLAAQGAEVSMAQATIDACEREQIAIGGFGPTSFAAALAVAAGRLLAPLGRAPDEALLAEVRACTTRLFSPQVALLPEVETTIPALAKASELVLVTKGEEDFQLAKLAGSGLRDYFQHARVLRHKDVAAYQQVVQELALDPAHTWMVGNSPRSDINPALRAGLGAVYVHSEHTWHQELEPLLLSPRLIEVTHFGALRELFAANQPA